MVCDHPPAIIRVVDDVGGVVTDYLARAGLYRACGDRVVFSGACRSSCTVYLSVPGSCATRSAVFGFHAPYWPGRQGGVTDATLEATARAMLASYPNPLRLWLGNRLTVGMRYLGAAGAAKLGAVRLCQ